MSEFYSESLDLNKNMEMKYKQSIELTIGSILRCCFNNRGIDVETEVFGILLQSMKVNEINDDISSFSKFNLETNTIIINKNKNISEETKYYDFLSTIMDIMSTNYINGKLTQGLIFTSEDGIKCGKILNDRIKDRLILMSFGETKYNDNIKDFFVDSSSESTTLLDGLFLQLDKVISSHELLDYYINGRADLFLDKVGKYGELFVKNLDIYNRDNSIVIRKECDEILENIINSKKENESKKIA